MGSEPVSADWDLPAEPWRLREMGFDPDSASVARSRCSRCATATSACAASSTRESRAICPARILNGCYETYPLTYAEAGYGDPESGELMINVTDGTTIRLLVDDEPFDLREGRSCTPSGCWTSGPACSDRSVRWCSPAGSTISVTSTGWSP